MSTPPHTRSIVAANVKALRKEHDISVIAAAEAVGVDRTYWYLLEGGRVNFTADKLEKVAALFEVSVRDLVTEGKFPRRREPAGARR
jgi:transcriptional regulator with XRE-family HTH domain